MLIFDWLDCLGNPLLRLRTLITLGRAQHFQEQIHRQHLTKFSALDEYFLFFFPP